MMPILYSFDLFGWRFDLPTYGPLLALAFLAALWAAMRQARAAGVETSIVTDLWIISLLAGVVGSKILLYVLDLDRYLADPMEFVRTLRSAGVFYGGLLAAVAASLVMVKRRGLNGWLIGDIAAPGIALGQAVGRWGCFAAGCCWGRESTVPWAVRFTDERAREITGVPLNTSLHPVQLYLSFADLVLFGVLLVVAARKKFKGQVLLLYLILYAVLRGTLEIFRGDPRGEVMGLSTSQAISILVGLVAIVIYWFRSRAKEDASRGASGGSHGGDRRAGGRRREAPAR